VARILGRKLHEFWGQPFIVDNRPGAGGALAGEITANANPDGYTLLFTSSSLTIQPSQAAKLPFDPVRDFTHVTQAVSAPYLLVSHPKLEARSVKELITLAKARPGKLNCATAGAGSAIHLAAELFNSLAGVNIVLVPYKGAVGLVDLMAGNVELSISGLPQTMPHVKSGRMRALAVTTPARSPLLPDVPSMAEAGLTGYDVTSWYGVIGPARMPRTVVNRLHDGVARALKESDVQASLTAIGISPVGSTPVEFAQTIKVEIERWKKLAGSGKT